ncbi:hypothetical protein VaNZ11_006131 [Volvox africanus]|uniref:Uncharacterized protein n=1 Tax=Volvox africanus TaxID=51714 RepID=A0ABQ5S0J1_9CHLO|nr:hypothetical protein VaNZ11_006131 [Volvox africanus]
MHMRSPPSFFWANSTGAPYGDTLGRIQPFSRSEVIWFLSSANSSWDMRYELRLMGTEAVSSIEWSTARVGGMSVGSAKTSAYWEVMCVISTPGVLMSWVLTSCTTQRLYCLVARTTCLNCNADRSLGAHSLMASRGLPRSTCLVRVVRSVTVLVLQHTCGFHCASQSLPSTTSKSPRLPGYPVLQDLIAGNLPSRSPPLWGEVLW